MKCQEAATEPGEASNDSNESVDVDRKLDKFLRHWIDRNSKICHRDGRNILMQVKVPGCWAEWAEISGAGLPVACWARLGSVGLGCSCVTSDLLSVLFMLCGHTLSHPDQGDTPSRVGQGLLLFLCSVHLGHFGTGRLRQNSKFKGRHR